MRIQRLLRSAMGGGRVGRRGTFIRSGWNGYYCNHGNSFGRPNVGTQGAADDLVVHVPHGARFKSSLPESLEEDSEPEEHTSATTTTTTTPETYDNSSLNPEEYPYMPSPLVQVIQQGSAVEISFPGQGPTPTKSIFHAPWLWYSDPTYIHPSSGQRTRRWSHYPGWKLQSAEIVHHTYNDNDNRVIIPHPPPPPGCLHSIGSIFPEDHPMHQRNDTDNHNQQPRQLLLKVTWDTRTNTCTTEDDDQESIISYYDVNWLQRCRYDDAARSERADKTRVTHRHALGRHADCPTIREIPYAQLFPNHDEDNQYDPATLLRLLHAIAQQGAVLVKDAPILDSFLHYNPGDDDTSNMATPQEEATSAVARVGRALSGGTLSHGNLYGDLFHVRSTPHALNVAYTTLPLSPHQDLAYFESKPGMQLLQCIRNVPRGSGGESVLVDAMAAAEYLRQVAPEHFETLCRSHATFMKQRDAADMVYSRPHIVCGGSEQQVVAVHWSPPFEAPPMEIPADDLEAYVTAYAAFERLLDDQLESSSSLLPPDLDAFLQQYAHEYTWERALEPGDILIFNNQRMLHGRRGFDATIDNDKDSRTNSSPVVRHLAGCYTNIDDTLNTYRVLLRQEELALDLDDDNDTTTNRDGRFVRGFGNGSPGTF